MTTITWVTAASYGYYEKRNRSVAEQNAVWMCQRLGRPVPDNLRQMSKPELVRYVMALQREMPE